MRLRNVGDKSLLDSSNYVIRDFEQYKGKYQKVFGNKNPLRIEVGMGKGNFIIEMALAYPKINFIGIEKFSSVLIRALQKIGDRDIPNLRLMVLDAIEIENIFNKEVELIYLNFSDPWPKKRHARRRLTSEDFLKRYDNIFKNDKMIIMKTDNQELFEYSLSSMSLYGYGFEEVTLDLASLKDKENITTEYEERFMLMGKPIYRVKAIKCQR